MWNRKSALRFALVMKTLVIRMSHLGETRVSLARYLR